MENEIKEILDKVLKTDVPMELAKLAIELRKIKMKDIGLFEETMKILSSEDRYKKGMVFPRLRQIVTPYHDGSEYSNKMLEEINKNPKLVEARDYFHSFKLLSS